MYIIEGHIFRVGSTKCGIFDDFEVAKGIVDKMYNGYIRNEYDEYLIYYMEPNAISEPERMYVKQSRKFQSGKSY